MAPLKASSEGTTPGIYAIERYSLYRAIWKWRDRNTYPSALTHRQNRADRFDWL